MVSLRVESESGGNKPAQGRADTRRDPKTAPNGSGVLLIDETGERKERW
jgi:hypothetical protein